MINQCPAGDIQRMYFIINEAARGYEGVIPSDCYHQPYMPLDELEREIQRVTFLGWKVNGEFVGIMGIEPVKDVTLIRHAYVLPQWQSQGIGDKLLNHLKSLTATRRLLVGTYTANQRAITFYRKHGFSLLADKDELLKKYWGIPQRQIETSIVMGIDINRN